MADLLNEIPRCCSSCEHLYKEATAQPCCNCNSNDLWVPNDYLRHLATIKRENEKK